MIRITLLRLCALLAFFFTCINLNSQTLSFTQINPDNLSICDQDTLSIVITNNDSVSVQNTELAIGMPTGIEYLLNSVVNATEKSVVQLSRPVFTIGNLLPKSRIVISLIIKANCNAYDKLIEGVSFQNNLIYTVGNTKDSLLSNPPYNITNPLLVISPVNDVTIELGTSGTRQVKITNTKLGPLKSFIFEDRHNIPAIITSKNRTILFESDQLLRIFLDGKDFAQIGDRDNLFETDEMIVIDEIIQSKECAPNSVDSRFHVNWGCDGRDCQKEEVRASSTANFIATTKLANLNFISMGVAPKCICQEEGSVQELIVVNRGSKTAENIEIDLKARDSSFTSPVNRGFIKDSIRISGNVKIDTIIYSNPDTICKGRNLYYSILIKITRMEINEEIKINFQWGSCESMPRTGINELDWYYGYSYSSECVDGSEVSFKNRRVTFNLINDQLVYASSSLNGAPNEFSADTTYKIYTTVTYPRNLTTQKLIVAIDYPCPLELTDTSFLLGSKKPSLIEIDRTVDVGTLVILTYLPPFFLPDSVITSCVKLDCNSPCIDTSLILNATRSITSCKIPTLLLAKYAANICTISQLSCTNDQGDCGPKQLACDKLEIRFNCIKKEKTDYEVPGYIDFNARSLRVSYGLEDKDNNRFADSIQRADTSLIRFDRLITGDTFCNIINGKIIVDKKGSSFDSVVILDQVNFNFLPLYGELDWYDASEKKLWKFRINNIDSFKTQNVILDCDKPTIVTNNLGDGWQIPITPELFNQLDKNYPTHQRFEEGDSFNLHYYHQNTSVVGTRIYNAVQTFRIILRDRKNSLDRSFFCGTKTQNMSIVTNCVRYFAETSTDTICGNQFKLPLARIEIFPHLKNFFPFEFRSWLKLDSFLIHTLPMGLQPDSIEFIAYYNDSFSRIPIRSMTVPFLRGRTFFVNTDSLKKLRFDEAYQIDLRVKGSIPDCKKLPLNNTLNVGITSYVSSDYPTPFHLEPINSTTRTSMNFSNNFRLIYNNVNAKLDLLNRTIVSNSKIITLDANLQDPQTSGSFKFKLGSKFGQLRNFNLTITPNVNISKTGMDEFQVGIIQPGRNYQIIFSAENFACDTDVIVIESIWACGAERIDSTNDCLISIFEIPVQPRMAELELDHFPKVLEEIELCDTLPEVELYLYNADLGTAYDVIQDIFIPDGLTLVPGSCLIAYPSNNSFQSIPLPQQLNKNQYRWNLSDIVPSIKINGLFDVSKSPLNGIRIKFKLLTSCNSSVNGYMNYLGSAKDICERQLFTPNRIGSQIKIKGINSSGNYELNSNLLLKQPCDTSGKITVSIKGSGLTLSGDSVKIFIPEPIEYDLGSFRSIKNMDPQTGVITNVLGGKNISFGLKTGIDLGNELIFEIEINKLKALSCGQIRIPIEVFSRQRTLCNSTQMDCDVSVIKSQKELLIDKRSMDIAIDSFVLVDISSSNNYRNSIYLDIKNSNLKSDSTVCFNLFQDINFNGQLDSMDPLLKEICFPASLFAKDGKLELNDLLSESLIISCHYILSTSSKNCICGPDTAYFKLEKLKRTKITDPNQYCSGSKVNIGINAQAGTFYKWTKGLVSCDTCSRNIVTIPDSIKSNTIFIYELSVQSPGSCNQIIEFIIQGVPEVEGLKFINELCYGDTIKLSSGTHKNIKWVGPGINNSSNSTQSILADSNKIIYLEYMDQANCPGIDTFCILVKKFSGTIDILPKEVLISYGDSVELIISGGVTWNWSPSTGLDCDTCQQVFSKPEQTTEYTIRVTDSLGCDHVLKTKVTVVFPNCDSSSIFIPNAFSPNKDDKNDIFRARSENITNIHLLVYNRWGEKIFESFNLSEGWDGTYKGQELPPDVYAYCIEAICPGDKKYFKKGNVTLLK